MKRKFLRRENNERYKNCYYYYDAEGNLIEYYETHYTVVIDRTPPENNINYLLENDTLVDYYVEEMRKS